MENAMVRPRYTRRPVQNKRYRKAPGTGGSLKRIIARQFIISAMLLVIVCIVKSINFSAANFVTDNVKYVISYNVELKSVFAYMEKLAAEIRDSISPVTSDKPAVSANQTTNTTRTSNLAQTSIAAQTSSITQTSIAAQAQDSDPPALQASEGNTATLSSSESMQGSGEVQDQAEKTMEASSSIENAADQYSAAPHSTVDDAATMPESSVLSASSESGQPNPSGLILPLDGLLISQFGEKSIEASGNEKTHKGIDIAAVKGISIKAALDGKVTETGSSPVYGGYIRILHADGLQTIYANCSKIIAKEGDFVKKGDTIADIGGTGTASVGIHLHLEIWKNGIAVDPLEYLSVPVR